MRELIERCVGYGQSDEYSYENSNVKKKKRKTNNVDEFLRDSGKHVCLLCAHKH